MGAVVQSGVRDIINSPDPDARTSLIVSVEQDKVDEFRNKLETEFYETHVEYIAYSDLLVETNQQAVEQICEIDYVTHVELDKDMEILSEDFRSQ